MKIGIIGAGAYALALAEMFNKRKNNIYIWTKVEKEYKELKENRTNQKALPNFILDENIKVTNNIKECIIDSSVIVIAVPAEYVDDISKEMEGIVKKNQQICIATKGIERDTCLFPIDVYRKHNKTSNIAVISGPSFARDIIANSPIGLSVATKSKKTYEILKNTLENDTLKLRKTSDIIGISICGSIKNVIAIASGMLRGLGYPESTEAMFITESLHDIKNLIKALGGSKKTILSYAGFGDLLLTCTSYKSRNFTFGYMIGSNEPKEKINEYINNTTIEGLYTLKSIHSLLKNKNVDMPIINLIYDIIFNNKEPKYLSKFLIEKE